MDFSKIYIKAYDMLGRTTPLRLDCGKLCGKACCEGDEDTGMYVYPGEEALLEQAKAFLTIKSSDLKTADGKQVKIAVCSGSCDRKLRPLACRLFPLVPYIPKDSDDVKVIIDPRASAICPAARYAEHKSLDRHFVRSVRRVCKMLADFPEISAFIKAQSRVIDDYVELQSDWVKRF